MLTLPLPIKANAASSFHNGPAEAANPEQAVSTLLNGKRAVIAEDQGVTQLQLRRILKSEGIEVVGMAANGREAIDIVLRTRPDLVLMDVQMPEMDGLEASRRILEQIHVCIVMLTAYTEAEHQQEARTIGTCGYVTKPVTAASLVPQLVAAMKGYDDYNRISS